MGVKTIDPSTNDPLLNPWMTHEDPQAHPRTASGNDRPDSWNWMHLAEDDESIRCLTGLPVCGRDLRAKRTGLDVM